MYCYKCMNEISDGGFCHHCNCENKSEFIPHHLNPGTVLNGKYIVGNALGEGGFGITYIGRDTTLDIKVAIKEYFPSGYVNRNSENSSQITATTEKQKDFFSKGKDRFLLEARSIAKFNKEKGIVDVRDYFEENGTAYIIMEYLEGENLNEYIKKNGALNARDLFEKMKPIMKSLEKMHSQGIIHRDISPDNIMYMDDGTLKLMDFGSARYFANEEKMMSVMLKQGYAPEEQYRKNGDQGPWTDVYSMCATIYKCVTGVVPEDALDRLHEDNIKKPSQLNANIDKAFEVVLMYGLAVYKDNRCKDMTELLSMVDKALSGVVQETPVNSKNDIYKTQVADDTQYKTQAADDDFYKTQMADGVYDEKQKSYAYSDNYSTGNISNSRKPSSKSSGINSTVIVVIIISALIVVGCVGYIVSNIVNINNTSQSETDSSFIIDDSSETEITLGNYEGMMCGDAITEIQKLGLAYMVEYEYSNTIEKDVVIAHDPISGSIVEVGDLVTLTISKGEEESPYEYSQKVVVAANPGSSSATLALYDWEEGGWQSKFTCGAVVGKNGITSNYGEGIPATPMGTFKLGTLITPDSNYTSGNWPIYEADYNTCIVDDESSPYYNMIVHKTMLPSGTSYDHTGKNFIEGDTSAMLFIEHNGNGFDSDDVVAGNGSAITICGMNTSLSATYGCIDILSSDMKKLINKLDYAKNTHIEIVVK